MKDKDYRWIFFTHNYYAMCAVICNFLYGALVPKYVIWYHGIFFYWDSPHTSSVGDSGASLINDRPANIFLLTRASLCLAVINGRLATLRPATCTSFPGVFIVHTRFLKRYRRSLWWKRRQQFEFVMTCQITWIIIVQDGVGFSWQARETSLTVVLCTWAATATISKAAKPKRGDQ